MPGHSYAIATPDSNWCSTTFMGVLPLLVFLTNKETLTGSSGFISSTHHRSNACRSSLVLFYSLCGVLPLLVFLTNKETFKLSPTLAAMFKK